MTMKTKDDYNQLAKVLEVLGLLIKYGYYCAKDDVDVVLTPLVNILQTDKPQFQKG